MAKNEESGTLERVIDGVTHTGTYSTSKGMVTVWYGYKSKTTQIGGSPLKAIANMLFGEMVGR